MSFSTYQLVQLVAINLFAMHHCKRKLHMEDNDTLIEEMLGKEELAGYNMVLSFTGNTLFTSSIRDLFWFWASFFLDVVLMGANVCTNSVLIGQKQINLSCSTISGELSCTNTKAREGQGVSYSPRNQDTA